LELLNTYGNGTNTEKNVKRQKFTKMYMLRKYTNVSKLQPWFSFTELEDSREEICTNGPVPRENIPLPT
jgi:hypothetical protein